MMATNQPAALSNLVTQTTGISIAAVETNNVAEQELEKIEDSDDTAAAEVDGWIRQNEDFKAKGAGIPPAELNRRIRARFAPVQKSYEDFIQKYPKYADGRVAYASFLHDMGDEDGQSNQLAKAIEIQPTLPSAWNNFGNYYGENGPITNAFVCYEKAIKLDPTESVYYQNLGTMVYLYRHDVTNYYHINEQQCFDKALLLYSNAMHCDPTNFPLATDVAMTYYGIKPLRTNDALTAWTNALKLAHDDVEREGVYIHLARIQLSVGHFAEAQARLDAVTNPMYNDLKDRLTRNLYRKEHPTNSTPTAADSPTNFPAKVP